MTESRELRIRVPVLARVEGEGALDLTIRDRAIESLQLRIYEPPRLFEKFLEGRSFHEVPDMVARICGICPVAYQMSAVQALESLYGVDPGAHIRAWRRLFYCGEWIQSHSLHIHLLAAPDFLGFDSVTAMAKSYPEEVRRGLRLQALGNDIIALLGGRSVHPVGACVGGFHRLPYNNEINAIKKQIDLCYEDASALLQWTAGLPLPDDRQAFCCVALQHGDEYPMNAGRIRSTAGLDIGAEAYEQHFTEFQLPHSTALYAGLHGQPYLVGPLARLNLNRESLPPAVRQALDATGIAFPSDNMFHSIVARAVEILLAVTEARRILDAVPDTAPARVAVQPRAATGFGCTEAPRGLLWHRYESDAQGHIRRARIVPPTSQNQARMLQDMKTSLEAFGLHHAAAALRLRAETVIRNYDPCISCATHFLRLNLRRSSP